MHYATWKYHILQFCFGQEKASTLHLHIAVVFFLCFTLLLKKLHDIFSLQLCVFAGLCACVKEGSSVPVCTTLKAAD